MDLSRLWSSCCYSVAKWCPTHFNPLNYSSPGFPVLHYLVEFAQTHVHWVGDNHLILYRPFSSCLQSFPASGSFPINRLFVSGGQSIGASASVLLMNIQGLFPLGLTGWISLRSKGLSGVFSAPQIESINSSTLNLLVQLSHLYMTTGKTIALIIWTFFGKVMSVLFNMLSRFVIAFLPRSKRLLISWLQSPSTVIWEPKKIKPVIASTFYPSICLEMMMPDAMILVF